MDNLRNSWNGYYQGPQNANSIGFLEEGMEWQTTQISPEDAEFLQTRQFGVLDVALIFGVPPHKLGDYSQSHLTNIEESNLNYIVTTLTYWAKVIESELNWKLLTRRDRKKWVILHDFTSLLRGNTVARTQYYQAMRNMGCFSADDILRLEGMNPLAPRPEAINTSCKCNINPSIKPVPLPTKPPNPTPLPSNLTRQTISPLLSHAIDSMSEPIKHESRALAGKLELRAAPEGSSSPGTLVGYAAVFNRLSQDLGYFREQIEPGAFADCLKRCDVRASTTTIPTSSSAA